MDDEEIENIKDFKKLILEREAFQIQIEKLEEEIKNLPVLYDKSMKYKVYKTPLHHIMQIIYNY